MALIQCPECGKAFSDKAVACPNCAYPLTDFDRIRLGIIDSKESLEKADLSYNEGKFTSAFNIYDAVSSRGNSEGLFKAGSMLCNGYGVEADLERGITYLKKSARENYPDALFFLGCIYDSNDDKEQALEYFEKSYSLIEKFQESEQAHIFYRLGELLPASQYERKIKLLNTAVEMGVAKAEDSLGQVYYTLGEASLENNDVNKAVEYLEQAQQHGLLKAKKLLGQCYYSLALKSQGEEKVRLLRKATKNDNDEARQILGEYYLETGSEAHNISTLEKASVLGNKDAMEKLSTYYNQKGAQYFSGDGVERDLEKAQEYFTKASDLGDESARKNLSVLYNRIGVYYYQGNEQVNPDYVKAEEYFKQATELGNKDAMENLGTLYNQYGDQYHSGDRVKRNYEIAEEFYLKAIKNGNEQAKKSLIMVYVTCYFNYKHGINGYVRDNVKANSYLSKARHTNPEMLEQIAKEYHTKAQQLIAHGINHHNYKMINSYLKKSSRLGKDDLTQELIDFYKAVALCYKKGNNGFDKDKSRANSYIRKAAELGDEEAIKKYKPTKQHKSLVKTAFESITGTSTVALKRAKNKGNYSYYYKDYND